MITIVISKRHQLNDARPVAMEGHSGEVPPNLFCATPNFVLLRKLCFKHTIITKICPTEMYLPPQNLKPGYGLERCPSKFAKI